MSTEAEIKANLEEIKNVVPELKKQIQEMGEKAKLANDPLFKESMEKVDTAIDACEKIKDANEAMVQELSALKAHGGYTDVQKAAKETSLKTAFNNYIKGVEGSSLHDCEDYKAEIELFKKENNISGSDAAGGFFVRPEHSSEIIARVFETSPLRGLASQQTIGTNEYIFPIDFSEPEGKERAETEAVTTTDGVSFFEVSIPVHEMYAYPLVSTHLLDDSMIDFEGYLTGAVSRLFGRKEATHFIKGTGTKQARGLTTYPDYDVAGVDQHDAIEQVLSETVDDVDYNGTIELVDALYDEFQANASLMMKRQVRTKLRRLVDTQNRPLWEPSIKQGVPSTYLGFPIFLAADMDNVGAGTGALGNKVIAFGDFAQGYQIVDRIGIRIIRDNITLPGFVKWNMSRRVGGGLRNGQAMKFLVPKA